jgi:hypothetical protein
MVYAWTMIGKAKVREVANEVLNLPVSRDITVD